MPSDGDLPVRRSSRHRPSPGSGRGSRRASSQRGSGRRRGAPGGWIDQDPLPLSFAQRQLWFLEQLEAGHSSYHVDLGWRLGRVGVDVAALGRALSELVERQEALRTVFPSSDGTPVQVVLPAAAVPLSIVDLADRRA